MTHLALAPSAGGDDTAAAVLAGLEGEDGQARVCLLCDLFVDPRPLLLFHFPNDRG